MRKVRVLGAAGLAVILTAAVGCGPKVKVSRAEVDAVTAELGRAVDVNRLTPEEREPFAEFCRLVALARKYDEAQVAGKVTDDEVVRDTQPIVDAIAAKGPAAEALMIRILEGRKRLDTEDRGRMASGENPEIYATVILWTLKSRRAVPLLSELARDSAIMQREVFIHALGRIGDPQALAFLTELTQTSKEPAILQEAHQAIAAIRKKQEETRKAWEKKAGG